MKLKKSLGQHFLHDEHILRKIASACLDASPQYVLEIGAGAGALTTHLIDHLHPHFKAVEIDQEKCAILQKKFPHLTLIAQDVLTIEQPFEHPFWVVGNFPYYISTQIVFKILDWRGLVSGMTGMFQKEVAERICHTHGSKEYGILSVLTQSYFDVKYLFDVAPSCFTPPPKVMSGVMQLTTKEQAFQGDYVHLKRLVKAAFNQRRKMLRNSLKDMFLPETLQEDIFTKRPEEISVRDFQSLAERITS